MILHHLTIDWNPVASGISRKTNRERGIASHLHPRRRNPQTGEERNSNCWILTLRTIWFCIFSSLKSFFGWSDQRGFRKWPDMPFDLMFPWICWDDYISIGRKLAVILMQMTDHFSSYPLKFARFTVFMIEIGNEDSFLAGFRDQLSPFCSNRLMCLFSFLQITFSGFIWIRFNPEMGSRTFWHSSGRSIAISKSNWIIDGSEFELFAERPVRLAIIFSSLHGPERSTHMQIRLSIPRATMPVSMKGTYGTTLFCWFLKCYQSDSWLKWNFSGIFVLMKPRDIVQRKITVVHSSCIDLSQRQCCIRMQSTPQMRQILHATTINDPDSSHKYWENSLKKNQTGDAGRSSSAITELDPSRCSLNFMERNRNWCERFAHRLEKWCLR